MHKHCQTLYFLQPLLISLLCIQYPPLFPSIVGVRGNMLCCTRPRPSSHSRLSALLRTMRHSGSGHSLPSFLSCLKLEQNTLGLPSLCASGVAYNSIIPLQSHFRRGVLILTSRLIIVRRDALRPKGLVRPRTNCFKIHRFLFAP